MERGFLGPLVRKPRMVAVGSGGKLWPGLLSPWWLRLSSAAVFVPGLKSGWLVCGIIRQPSSQSPHPLCCVDSPSPAPQEKGPGCGFSAFSSSLRSSGLQPWGPLPAAHLGIESGRESHVCVLRIHAENRVPSCLDWLSRTGEDLAPDLRDAEDRQASRATGSRAPRSGSRSGRSLMKPKKVHLSLEGAGAWSPRARLLAKACACAKSGLQPATCSARTLFGRFQTREPGSGK